MMRIRRSMSLLHFEPAPAAACGRPGAGDGLMRSVNSCHAALRWSAGALSSGPRAGRKVFYCTVSHNDHEVSYLQLLDRFIDQ